MNIQNVALTRHSANKIHIDESKKKEEKSEDAKKNKGFFGKMKEAVEDLFEEE